MLSPARLAAFAVVLVCSSPDPAAAGARSRGPTAQDCPWWRPCGSGETWGGNRLVPQGAFGIDIRPACQRHDDCYDDPTTRRKECDLAFLNELKCMCEGSDNPRACKRRARVAYLAVRLLGASSKE